MGDLPNDRVLGCVINKTEHAEKQYSFTPVHVIGSIHKLKNFDHSPIAFEREVVPYFDQTWLKNLKTTSFEKKISPPQFLTQIAIQARKANQRIVLPEGTEPRTIQAASVCTEQKIARCVLLGKPDEIQTIAKEHHIALHHDVECIDPETIRHLYIEDMVELRKNRNLTPDQAAKKLEDNVYLGAMMLHKNEVDGLVSGSIHTTANTVRPAFQLIRTAPHFNIISSVFFMCLPDQVLLYADCAIIPKPSVEELAEIAIQSADTAKAFGIPPYVSLISYSTGESGEGISVESIRDAVQIVRKQRPDIPIDGPIQYDAAVNESVGKRKAPDSPVAGKTTVCIFPDLNTGNAVYKAVQQSTKILSLGPVLQGIKKPVNDLSRGCSSEDIVYTIALAAVQASLTT
ncbi:MAG: phosphate acetyltransferase [Gammaproteobacteria bacterium]|nr:phosphate acetyltransferase [Gammaproteobacteria bacterium]MBU1628810.1 phosphate acetyltransferase [Gammaproteobacteria bacterium]MBU1926184.1 phosphate acetyltransferase [Gammaproteobacteria bacterium]MBU2545542.1 phosphate acetyltransferase [Gammaproteobacteria bacterium]